MDIWDEVMLVEAKAWQRFALWTSHSITYTSEMKSLNFQVFVIKHIRELEGYKYFEIVWSWVNMAVTKDMVISVPKEYHEEKFEFTKDFLRFKKGEVYKRKELSPLQRGFFTLPLEELSILKKL